MTGGSGAAYGLILAAGRSTRFGGDKLVAALRGRPLIAYVASTIEETVTAGVLGGAVAVVPPRATGIAWQLEVAGIRQVENPAPETGLAGSLQRGLAALESETDPAAGAALIVLADQPLVSGTVIRRLVTRWHGSGKSVRPRYAASPDTPGHPVLLDRSAWGAASLLSGDRGLGLLLAEHPEWCEIQEVAGANPDIDTPDDLKALDEAHG